MSTGISSREGDARLGPASQETCRQPRSHASTSVGVYRRVGEPIVRIFRMCGSTSFRGDMPQACRPRCFPSVLSGLPGRTSCVPALPPHWRCFACAPSRRPRHRQRQGKHRQPTLRRRQREGRCCRPSKSTHRRENPAPQSEDKRRPRKRLHRLRQYRHTIPARPMSPAVRLSRRPWQAR